MGCFFCHDYRTIQGSQHAVGIKQTLERITERTRTTYGARDSDEEVLDFVNTGTARVVECNRCGRREAQVNEGTDSGDWNHMDWDVYVSRFGDPSEVGQAPVIRECDSCSAINESEANFCIGCGKAFAAVT